MRVIALAVLRDFWRKHPLAQAPLQNWYAEARRATWRSPAEVKQAHRSASFLAGDRVVFNVKGNDYRLIVAIRYRSQIMYVRLIGTHRDYDKVDATTV